MKFTIYCTGIFGHPEPQTTSEFTNVDGYDNPMYAVLTTTVEEGKDSVCLLLDQWISTKWNFPIARYKVIFCSLTGTSTRLPLHLFSLSTTRVTTCVSHYWQRGSIRASWVCKRLVEKITLFVIVCITSILHVFLFAYITTFWFIHGSSAQEEFDHVYSTVNKKKKKMESDQTQDTSDSTEKEVATCTTSTTVKHDNDNNS